MVMVISPPIQYFSSFLKTLGNTALKYLTPSFDDLDASPFAISASVNVENSNDTMVVIPTDINFYVYRVLSWLVSFDGVYIIDNYNHETYELIKYSLECAKNVLSAHEIPMSVFPLVIYYADKFVQKCGINHKQIFNLLLISSIISVKFYGETVRCDYQTLGKYFNFTGKDLCYMERLFLNGIGYELYVHNNLIKEFLEAIDKEKYNFQFDVGAALAIQ
eukprot:gene8471-9963_t